MSPTLLKAYHLLPPFARNWAATARGWQLKRWRYGPETDRLVQEALARDTWSQEQWAMWQNKRLGEVLEHAATSVPFYRAFWQENQKLGGRGAWSRLENWPILEKNSVRKDPRAFLADGADTRQMFSEHTTGTTGTPLELWASREAKRFLYSLFEARIRLWNNVSRHQRWAILTGQLVTPVSQTKPPFWVWNPSLKQLYMSSYHLGPDFIPAYLAALQAYRVEYIFGYSSSLYAMAKEILESNRTDIRMKVALSNAEPLYDYQKEAIAKAFGCPVRETYGNAEGVSAAAECSAGKLHLWPELGITEVMEGDQPVPEGESGDLVCTGLANPMMPLIRYRIGDRARLASPGKCSCGRTLPILECMEGRIDDTLITGDGRLVGRLSPVLKGFPLSEAQIIQEAPLRIRIKYVAAANFAESDKSGMIQSLRKRMGPVEVVLEAVVQIPREPGGKFRAVICRLSAEEKRQLMKNREGSASAARCPAPPSA